MRLDAGFKRVVEKGHNVLKHTITYFDTLNRNLTPRHYSKYNVTICPSLTCWIHLPIDSEIVVRFEKAFEDVCLSTA